MTWRGYDANGECLDCDEPEGADHAEDCPARAVFAELADAMLAAARDTIGRRGFDGRTAGWLLAEIHTVLIIVRRGY